MAKIGIIGAMDVEVDTLKAEMTADSVSERGGLEFFQGTLRGLPAAVVRCGVGKVNAALCVQALADLFGVTHIINTGIAGAISPDLRPGDMVVSTDAVYHDFDATGFGYPPLTIPGMDSVFRADESLRGAALSAGQKLGARIFSGRIATGDAFIASGAKKRAIRDLCAPLCVEMEGAAIAHGAHLNGVPFVIIRCISDLADDSGGADYSFNEKAAAETSASLVLGMLDEIAAYQSSTEKVSMTFSVLP